MSKTKTHPSRVQGFETLREVGDSIAEQIDVKSSWDEVWSEVFGTKKKSSEHKSSHPDFTVTDPVSGEQSIFDIKAHNSQKSESKHNEKAPVRKEAAIDHHGDFVRSSEKASKQETREINQRLQDIMAELQKLVSSSKVLQMEFAGVTVDQAPQQAGEYHLNFFDWLLLTIRAARQKVEDSGAWLATNKKKGGGKGKWNNKQRKDWFANTSMSMNNESGGGYINQTG